MKVRSRTNPTERGIHLGSTPSASEIGLSAQTNTRLQFWVTYPVWLVVSALVLSYALFPGFLDQYQYVPFLVGLVLLGLPHGAMDHLVIPRLTHQPPTPRLLVAFLVWYGILVALYLLLWQVFPLTAFGLFLLISWFHWGQGDAYALEAFLGRPPPRSLSSLLLIWAVRGALPIVLPPLVFPAVFHAVAQGIVGWYAPASSAFALSAREQRLGLAALAALILVYLAISWRDAGRTHRRVFWADAFEIALLIVLFSRVPPVLAVGVYFCVWHSWRHIARLMASDSLAAELIAQGRLRPALGRAAWQSVPMTLGALLLLGGIYLSRAQDAHSASEFVFLYLSLIAALTLPHFFLVIWMDWKQGQMAFSEGITVEKGREACERPHRHPRQARPGPPSP